MKIIKLYTYWRGSILECCCPVQNKCNRNHGCELMRFFYDEYEGIEECMKARKYKRNKHGALEQK